MFNGTGTVGAKGTRGDKGDIGIPGICSRQVVESITSTNSTTSLSGDVRTVLDKLYGACVEDFMAGSGTTLSSAIATCKQYYMFSWSSARLQKVPHSLNFYLLQ